ncbi:MAG TPA: glucans biosynthesis glucosyltransferase MdoH [Polyangiaceae bacterium]|jgi:membrane glycosyltransferase|nr:glucans biosynthesis glucosyltransferase MdoH [Polyangiaceae bacterium]
MSREKFRSIFVVTLPVVLATAFASGLLGVTLSRGGWSPPEILLQGTFTILFTWIAFWLWVALIGAYRLAATRKTRRALAELEASRPPLETLRTAIVVPIHNEDPDAVFARVRSMLESLAAVGASAAFEMFVLSDTTDPDIWLREELAWAEIRKLPGLSRIFYRRRLHKFRKKSGNIADFCKRWGARYEHMIVLDADSIMDGAVMVEMVRRMEAAPGLGILQAPSMLTLRDTLFARAEQFAAATYGPAVFAGIAYCFGSAGNYWGHNAIVRVKPFAEQCGLPGLPGRPPFGGPILSHDFVEAALMRRAGFEVRLAWDLTVGSYEQGPASLDIARERDVRWCRGNLQHLRLVFAPAFSAGSRAHFAIGALFYGISGLWAAYILFVAARYAMDGESGVTTGFEHYAPLVLSGCVAFVLLGGKVLAAVLAKLEAPLRAKSAKLVRSTALEILLSTLIAPIRMVSQLTCVIAAVSDTSMDWAAARRDEQQWTLRGAIRSQGLETAVGIVLAVTLFSIGPGLALWLSPVWLGLLAAIPVDALLSSRRLGRALRARGLFVTPAEAAPPEVIRRALELEREHALAPSTFAARFESFVTDAWLNTLHVGLLRAAGSRELSPTVVEPLVARILADGIEHLSKRESIVVLSDATVMERLHRLRCLERAESSAA